MIKIEFVSIFTGISERELKHFNEYSDEELKYTGVNVIEYVKIVTTMHLDIVYNRFIIPYNIWQDDNLIWNHTTGFTDYWKKIILISELKG